MSGLPDVDVERLISAVQSKPVLWDKTSEKYKDKFRTQEAWKEVTNEIYNNLDELDVTKKIELNKHTLKKWTQVRDSYRKSIAKTKTKSGAGASKVKEYIYKSQLQFLDKVLKERETEDTLSKSINVDDGSDSNGNDEENSEHQSDASIQLDASAGEKPESSFKKPQLKKRKMDAIELKMIEALKETPNRHLSFFKRLLPSLEDFHEYDTLDFQMEVLKIVKKIRLRKHPLPCTSDTFHSSSSYTSPIAASSDTLPIVTFIPQNTVVTHQQSIKSQDSTVQFYEDCLQSSSNDSIEYTCYNCFN